MGYSLQSVRKTREGNDHPDRDAQFRHLIANTTTEAGLQVKAHLDENVHPTGVKVSDQELETVQIRRSVFHGDRNYVIHPRNGS